MDRVVLLAVTAAFTLLGFVALQYDDPESFRTIVAAFAVFITPGAMQRYRSKDTE